MIKKILTLGFLFIAVFSYTQEEFDTRLLERYTPEELTAMKKNNPEEFQILNHALDVGISIGEIHEKPGSPIPFEDEELDADPHKEQTYISLGLTLKNKTQYFKFKGTNMMVIVRPKNRILDIHQTK